MTNWVGDGARLAVGTLTRIPVRPPASISSRSAWIAMSMAPLVGLAIGVLAEVAALGTRWAIPGWDDRLLVSVVSVVTIALITGGIHLDGLADTADGLGSGKSGADALVIMRRSDIGSFGAAALVLLLLLQVAALNTALLEGKGTVALVGGAVVARLAITVACRHGRRAARSDGLGVTVIGSVPMSALAVTTALTVLAVAAGAFAEDDVSNALIAQAVAAIVVVLVVTELFCAYCTKRLGGLTGDTLGAVCEISFALFVFIIALG